MRLQEQSIVLRPQERRPLAPQPLLEVAEPERRQLTVVFCDLVGSTALSQRLDPEELRDVILAYRRVCAERTRHFGGYIARYLGDGLLIYFGYPRAHDDDAVMAVRAALELIGAVRRLRLGSPSTDQGELRVHLGVHTGLVVAGVLGSGDTRVPAEIIGDTPNLAARLVERAEPNTVLISEATFKLVRDQFDCQSIGNLMMKGMSQPVQAFRVRSEVNARSRLYVLKTRHLTPLIGRDDELGLLVERWREVQEGSGSVITITGEPGIGKSRLVQALQEELANEPHIFVSCYCSPRSLNSAFSPIIDLLERQFGFGADDAPTDRLDKLERALKAAGLPLAESVPFLAFLLSVPLLNRYFTAELSSSGQREKTMEWVLAWVMAQAASQPLVVAVEDLHWADASTLDLLTLLIEQIAAARILLLLTFRPEFQPPWGFPPHLTDITLARLSSAQVAMMIDSLTKGRPLPPQVYKQVLERTDGIPLFIEETAKMVVESGIVTLARGRYELANAAHRLSIPATLRDSLTARLDRLGSAKSTAQLAATLGHDFSYELLQAVSPLDASELDHDLAILVKAELLTHHGLPPRATYTFKHSLIQEAAYESLLRSTRRRYHLKVATALVQEFPETAETRPELIADHYTWAGTIPEAVRHWRIAGQRALERSANVEAAAHLKHALELITNLPASPQRDQDEATLQISIGAAVAATKGYGASEVEAAYARARALCEGLDDTPQVYSALRGLLAFYQVRGPLGAARTVGELLLRIAQQSNDSAMVAEAKRPLGWCMFCIGAIADADRLLAAALGYGDSAGANISTLTFGINTRVMGLANSAWGKCYLGHLAEALNRSHEAIRLGRAVSHPQSLAYALCMSAAVHQNLRDADAVQDLAEQTIAVANENAFSYWIAWATILQGWAVAERGDVTAGMATLRAGLDAYRATGAELFRPYSLALLAEACGKAGLAGEGLNLIGEAFDSGHRNDVHFYDAELCRLKGDLLLMSGASGEVAEPCYARAIEIARAQGARLLELRAAVSLQRLQRTARGDAEAKRRLAEVLGAFTDDLIFDDLVEARAILSAG